MKCPVDRDELIAGKTEAHTGFGCTTCKGSWLPKNYIDSIQYTKTFEPQKFFTTLQHSVHHVTHSKCPVNCGALSAVTDVKGISYCPSCLGVWFESKALKSMLNKYQTKRENAAIADIPNATIGIFDLLATLFK